MNQTRKEVLKAIETERDYQLQMVKDDGSHVVEDFPLGSALSAIQHNLDEARKNWYNQKDPHKESMQYLRKIAAICVQMGEKLGMPERPPIYLQGKSENS